MEKQSREEAPDSVRKNTSALRDERLSQLLESCQQEVLRQIIGPFGLTPAMFKDKDGGSVTTQYNAEKGIFAKESEEFDRSDYDYQAAKKKKMQEAVKDGSMNSQEFVDAYTGNTEPTKRTNNSGKFVMNAELDHTVPVKEMHGAGGWMKDKEGRTGLSSVDENLNYTTHSTNRSKSDKPPEDALSAEKGFDPSHVDPIVQKARDAVENELPSTSERVMYHGKELAKEGGKEAAKNALRRALGVLLHEFVSSSFGELKSLLKDRETQDNLIDRLINGLKRVMNSVMEKGQHALDAALQGGVQGLVSNLLTFMINNLVTTSKKIVSIIRESMQSLWGAIKMIVNPPEGITTLELMREVTKIIAAVVTTAVGMMLEESVKGFILSVPLLVPIAEGLSTALTAIMTGISGALIVYGIDRLFDWFGSTGTEILAAQEAHMEAQGVVGQRLQLLLSHQFENSRLIANCIEENRQIERLLADGAFRLEGASLEAAQSISSRDSVIDQFESQMDRVMRLQAVLKSI